MFDITLQVVQGEVISGEESLELRMILGLTIPGPNGEPQGILPGGVVRVPLGREISLKLGQDLVDAGEKLPEPPKASDLTVVTDPSTVAKATQDPTNE